MKAEYDFSNAKRGAISSQAGKTHISLYLDDDILEAFQKRGDAEGRGYQSLINQALREYLRDDRQPLDEETLRRVLQEELRAVR